MVKPPDGGFAVDFVEPLMKEMFLPPMGGRGRGGGNRLSRFGGPAGRFDLPSSLGESNLPARPRSQGNLRPPPPTKNQPAKRASAGAVGPAPISPMSG